MNVLLLISSEGHFGAENMLITLGRALSRQGCTVVVGVFDDCRFQHTEVADHASKAGLRVEMIPCRGRVDLKAVAHVRKLMRDYRIDVVHAHGYKTDIYSYLAAWPNGPALIATCHNWPNPSLIMRTYAKLDRVILRAFAKVAVISTEVQAKLLRAGLKPERVSLIANGVDLRRFESARSRRDHSRGPVIGFVGRLVKEKGGEALIEAAKKVTSVRPEVKIVFAGDGPCRREWEEAVHQAGLADKVTFLGVCSDMPAVYASFDVVVLPSLIEAMPMCLLEAMASRKPVVATRVGSIPQVIEHGDSGLLVDPGDAEGLGAALLEVLGDSELSERLAENGSKRAKARYTDDAMAISYLRLYEAAAGRPPQMHDKEPLLGVVSHE